jgi:hypothetical protein
MLMRLFTLATVASLLVLAAAEPAGRASPPAPQCPVVRVSCPDVVRSGEEVSFSAEVVGAGAAFKPSFAWEVSAGSIADGQGTATLKVDTAGVGQQTLTASVEVEGLSPACDRKASCSTPLMSVVSCGRFDEYGDIKFDDEKARLDNFAIELQNDPTSQGQMICYGGRTGYEGEALSRCERAKDYLSGVRGIEAARVVIVDGGFREELTVKLTIVPAGAAPPTPSPTLDRSEVKFIKPPSKRGAPRQ